MLKKLIHWIIFISVMINIISLLTTGRVYLPHVGF